MKMLSLAQWGVVLILALLTALEPLSIDLYLPGFLIMSDAFKTDMVSVQMSLSLFLAGFAIGQLIWGPLSDRFGRKKPILLSLMLFVIASVACIYVTKIEYLWGLRFVQAIGGCGGIVISRAVVTDYFNKDQTLKIFSLLTMIMGVAPIVAPLLGNQVLHQFHNWESLFATMMIIGVALFLLTFFFLPETKQRKEPIGMSKSNVLKDYHCILKNRKFLIYALVAGITNGALMIYVSNGPFLIMDKGGFSSDMFSVIFSINSLGLILGSYSATLLTKHIKTGKLIKQTLFVMLAVSAMMLMAMYSEASMSVILIFLFCYVFMIGILLPLTTELALSPFMENNSGAASSLFGTIQMTLAFACTLISGLMSDGTMVVIGIEFVLCALLAFITVFGKMKDQFSVIPQYSPVVNKKNHRKL